MRISFKTRVWGVWGVLAFTFLLFVSNFDLKVSLIVEKLPFLLGLKLTPNGFLQGVPLTLFLCAMAMVFSTILGFVSALGRLSNSAVAFGLATFYTSFFRGTPLLVQILLIYLGLPQLGPVPTAIPSGIAALSLCYGAYISEIFRAGIQSVPQSQREAAIALGLPGWLVMYKVVLPQAFKLIIPPLGAQFISMLKDSSLVSVMGLWEIMFLSQSYGRSTYRYMEMLLTAAVLYWVLSIIFETVQARIESRFSHTRP
ncbi:amino acid ABC transporter permease [Pararhodospirillum photometricum]|uniref:amino acid ABC transporter permease n=1 Tax=Pararhodospirillum photometricum TaxID=1084 RepID=UPI001F577B0D|nr:amino acid ABC transporter permease [Pararhodospirillum photometricum]